MYNIKKINKEYVNRRIQRNPELANDTTHSNSNVSLIMMIGFVLRTVKLMITVASFSYFIGMGWILPTSSLTLLVLLISLINFEAVGINWFLLLFAFIHILVHLSHNIGSKIIYCRLIIRRIIL